MGIQIYKQIESSAIKAITFTAFLPVPQSHEHTFHIQRQRVHLYIVFIRQCKTSYNRQINTT